MKNEELRKEEAYRLGLMEGRDEIIRKLEIKEDENGNYYIDLGKKLEKYLEDYKNNNPDCPYCDVHDNCSLHSDNN